MKILDRLLIRSFLKSYLICLISLLSMYVVVDLFTNIDDLKSENGIAYVVWQISTFYSFKIFQIFDRLSETIVLMGAMFTISWMQRHNELLPFLSAGVSTRRIIRPVLVAACAMLSLTTLNQELIIPRISNELFMQRSDPEGEEDIYGPWYYDSHGMLIHGSFGKRTTQSITPCYVSIPGNGLVHLKAEEAFYIPAGEATLSGGWLLVKAEPAELTPEQLPKDLVLVDPGKYFLKKPEIDFDLMTRSRKWFIFSSTSELYQELGRPDSQRLSPMAVLFHMRLTRPILGILLVCLGLGVILRDQNRNVFLSTGICLALTALFFAAIFACKFLGDYDYLSPALAAWLPVLFFAPMAFVLLDAVHT